MSRVIVFDTTLRDGEQSPGASMTSAEKREIARALARLRVDVIEAGFPAASPDDLEAVRAIARDVGNDGDSPPIICGLARARAEDLAAAFEAVKDAARPRIHTFLATSPIHRKHKLGMSRAEVIERVRDAVARARELVDDVEFSAEDACRTEPGFLCEVLAAAIEAGATTLNVPDTVGYATPLEMDRRMRTIRANVPGIEDVVLSVHCHDDLGMATANTLAAVGAGARQVEVTINGVGERAGNTALEEVVMALHTRQAFFGLETGIDTTQIHKTSRLVSTLSGMPVQPNKAVVGANAFAHEAGIHQDGMLKARQTYEIMRPETIGRPESELVLGKHSGRHALKVRLAELGYPLDDDALEATFARFKALADRKKHVTNADLLALVSAREEVGSGVFRLAGLDVRCGTGAAPSATVKLLDPAERPLAHTASGSGPVDACFRAIDEIVGVSPRLLEYRVHAVTEGIDALGEVSVRVSGADYDDKAHPQWDDATRPRVFHGYGADTDIIVASAHAYVAALNRLIAAEPALVTAKAS
ncbi:MAG: 2-isopropylmalate synthase [Sandaracinaceae bacterium]|nr:2-isopropylmalate synthase [Sandaracinaceae bacterium]